MLGLLRIWQENSCLMKHAASFASCVKINEAAQNAKVSAGPGVGLVLCAACCTVCCSAGLS